MAYSIFIFRFVLVQIFVMNSTGNKVALGKSEQLRPDGRGGTVLSAAVAAALAAGRALMAGPAIAETADTPQQHL